MTLISTVGAQEKSNVDISGIAPVMKAKHVENLKMDGKLSDPAWKNASEYQLELAKNVYAKSPDNIRKTLGDTLREKGSVKLLWNEKYLYVGVKMEDSDVVAEGKGDQTHLYLAGDLVEVFLKPASDTYYWEIYSAPNNMKSIFFFPSRGRIMFPFCEKYQMPVDFKVVAAVDGTLNNWHDKDKGWSVEIAIPISMLQEQGAKFDSSTEWTILVARYNYSKYLPMKETSSAPRLSVPDNHMYEDYAKLVLEK
ncbi:MAG: carbohydrate-binding family 9-like protein [Phycisphaerae bacterium]|jgi:hypothetical protein